MTVRLRDVVAFLDEVLEIDRFRDYGPNGLQVEGAPEVDVVVTGVSAHAELFERAIARNADLIVVHHGLIWGAGIPRVVGPTAVRLRMLLENAVSLAAYHLPLDAHPTLGNNAGLCDALGLGPDRRAFGDVRGHALGVAGAWPTPVSRDEAIERIARVVLDGAPPAFVLPYGPGAVRTVGVCTGAASDLLESAAAAGCDLFVTGELAERSASLARELQITLVGAGHHRTEVYGAIRLADALAAQFPGIDAEFVDVPSPL
ncbi:MAG: Nif3-like dinuclear metal center hexameric protein [Deltaproteobacteria bacterium]|nr:MAG: Nif3-like dinuclear metal center hexameric protein [Deltaproteobacteria bacterium]